MSYTELKGRSDGGDCATMEGGVLYDLDGRRVWRIGRLQVLSRSEGTGVVEKGAKVGRERTGLVEVWARRPEGMAGGGRRVVVCGKESHGTVGTDGSVESVVGAIVGAKWM